MLTEANKLTVCEILGITPLVLNYQIQYLGDKYTPDIETAIIGKIAEWTTGGVGRAFSSFTPTESNKGFNLSSDAAKNQIRSSLAFWLERPDWAGGNGFLGRLSRS